MIYDNRNPLGGMGRGEGSRVYDGNSGRLPRWVITQAGVDRIKEALASLQKVEERPRISEILTVKQFAEKMGVSKMTVQKWLEKGRLEGAVRFGGVWAIPSDAPRPKDLRQTQNGIYALPEGSRKRPGRPKVKV